MLIMILKMVEESNDMTLMTPLKFEYKNVSDTLNKVMDLIHDDIDNYYVNTFIDGIELKGKYDKVTYLVIYEDNIVGYLTSISNRL